MKRKTLVILLCVIFAGIALYSGYQILGTLYEYKAGEDSYSQLQQYISVPEDTRPAQNPTHSAQDQSGGEDMATEPEATIALSQDPEPAWPRVDFDALHQINTDVVGWIYLAGTKVNFPVVQGSDNQEYLYWLINGDYNSAGTPFVDYRNSPDFSDRHTIIYGHNMNNGSMFADIHKYTDQSFYEAHPVICLLTPGGNYEMEIFAGYITGVDANAWQLDFYSDEEFETWLGDALDRSLIRTGIVPEAGDRVVTLSTCSNSANQTRFVLLGVLR